MKSIFLLAIFGLFFNTLFCSAQVEVDSISTSTDSVDIKKNPIWPGCDENLNSSSIEHCFNQSLAKHIQKTLIYPNDAIRKDVQGRVMVSFIISNEGRVRDAKIVSQKIYGSGLEEEALRVIQLIPLVKPATVNGNPVYMKFIIPIVFRLE